MTPGARIEAAIELLAEIDALESPADRLARAYFRQRRYIGSKDRRAISNLLYGVLRHRARIDWWLGRAAVPLGGARARVLGHLTLCQDKAAAELGALFDGTGHSPPALGSEEAALVQGLEGQALDHPEQPDWVRHELPEWLWPRFVAALGEAVSAELTALGREAPLDLRVNTLKADRETALAALTAEGVEAAPTPLSPLGLRVTGRQVLPNLGAFRDGLVEVQDEGSQIVALLTDARPGMAVADLCAGAGGKTLALAAAMAGEGRLVAFDRDARRLERARGRLARAGAEAVELRPLPDDEPEPGPEDVEDVEDAQDAQDAGDPWWAVEAGAFDRVLVDAPCSGSGAWRRNPDARWQLSEARLDGYLELQAGILERAAALVAPGGRLVYATCSLLDEENHGQVARFLEAQPDFTLLPVAELWPAVLPTPYPGDGPELLLTPARHGTDGFYLAVLERRAER